MNFAKTELSAYEIATAFPDEAREFIPKLLDYYNKKLLPYKEIFKKIDESDLHPEDKTIAKQLNKDKEYIEIIEIVNKYKKVMEIIQNGEDKRLVIEKAKQTKIQDLFTLNKARETTLTIKCCCPFHEDKTPSFYIYKNTNSFFCFSCNQGGDVIEFMMKYKN